MKEPSEIHDEGPGLSFWFPVFIPLGLAMWLLIIGGGWRLYNWYVERPYRAALAHHKENPQ